MRTILIAILAFILNAWCWLRAIVLFLLGRDDIADANDDE